MRIEHMLPLAATAALACMPTPLDTEDTSSNNDNCVEVMQDLIIENEADVLALPQRCFNVKLNSVYVNYSDREDLAALANLREVKSLRIEGNTLLRSTAGLVRVKVTQELFVADNPQLVDIVGLDPTEELERVTIASNGSLADVFGLRNVKRITRELRVEGASNLDSLIGFEHLEEAGAVRLQDTTGIGAVGLELLDKVAGNLTITRNADLGHIGGLGYLSSVGGDLTIESNPGLRRIDGFTAEFTTVMGSVKVSDNAILEDTRDLQNLYTVGGSLICTYNPLLSKCRASDLQYFVEDVAQDVDVGDNSPNWDQCY